MATIDWPATLVPQQFSPGLRKSGLQFRSPFNGTAQAVDFVAERWVYSLTLPPRRSRDGNPGQAEALLAYLAGGVERVRCWHFARPAPLGTMRGTPTLSSGASRGNTSIAITGATAGVNLMPNSSFEIDSNADGVADGITLFVGGAGDGARTYNKGLSAAPPSHGSYTQYVEITAAGNSEQTGLQWTQRPATAGEVYTISADIRTASSNKVYILLRWFDAGLVQLSDSTSGFVAALGYLATNRVSFSAVAPANAAWVEVQVRGINGVGQYMALDALQLERGAVATAYAGFPTLKAGDLLGLGGQILMVKDDVTLNDAGAGTVTLVNRVRATNNTGAAVLWDKPTAEFIMPSAFAAASYRPAVLEGMPFDLEEVW